jgi:SAM-dependent methyltransferase
VNLIDRATVIHFHRHRIAEFGADSVRALGWVSEASQTSRFEAIAQAGDFNDSSVLDLGCGTGDLKAFLDTHFPEHPLLVGHPIDEIMAFCRKLSPRVSLVRCAWPAATSPSRSRR